MSNTQINSQGQNASPAAGKKIPVVELFGPTIEGEGAVIGTQTFFIRFGLCDYKCAKCDSMHAVDPTFVKKLAKWRTQEELLADFLEYTKCAPHIKTVTFSGGNPAIHNLSFLVSELQSRGWKIVVETQGTKIPKWMLQVDHLVVSPKSPGMGEQFDHTVFSEFMRQVLTSGGGYSIKIVVFSAQDLEFAVGVASLMTALVDVVGAFHSLADWHDRFYLSLGNPFPPQFRLQAVDDDVFTVVNESPENIALVEDLMKCYNNLSEEIMKDSRLSFAKFLPQLHVLVWGNETEK